MKIRTSRQTDIPALQKVLQATQLFPAEMLPDMVAGFLSEDPSDDLWLTCERAGTAIGFCYAVPEAMTEGTWNMLALAVAPDQQGIGAGRAITAHLEGQLHKSGARILIADTSGVDAFADTRAFYAACGYTKEARIRDFWAAGDDKVVFRKALSGSGNL